MARNVRPETRQLGENLEHITALIEILIIQFSRVDANI